MSFYGYTPIPKDYSYVKDAFGAVGQIGAAVAGHIGEKKQTKELNDKAEEFKTAFETDLTNDAGMDGAVAERYGKLYFSRFAGESNDAFRARLGTMVPKATEFWEKKKAEYQHKQGAKELRPQMAAYIPGGVVPTANNQPAINPLAGIRQGGGEGIAMLNMPKMDDAAMGIQPDGRGVPPQDYVPTRQRRMDEMAKVQFGPQSGRGATQAGGQALNTSGGARELQAQAGVMPEQTGGWKAQQGADRPWSERLSMLNDHMNDDKISKEAYERFLKELELEATNDKDKAAAAAAQKKDEDTRKHQSDEKKKQRDWQSKEKDLDRKSAQYIASLRKYKSDSGSQPSITTVLSQQKSAEADMATIDTRLEQLKTAAANGYAPERMASLGWTGTGRQAAIDYVESEMKALQERRGNLSGIIAGLKVVAERVDPQTHSTVKEVAEAAQAASAANGPVRVAAPPKSDVDRALDAMGDKRDALFPKLRTNEKRKEIEKMYKKNGYITDGKTAYFADGTTKPVRDAKAARKK